MRRDIKSLNLIIGYCDDVASDIARFGDDIEDLTGDESYRRSTAESIEFMGERAKRLSDDVTSRFKEVDWHEICKMRDFMAHQYEEVDPGFQWSTVEGPILTGRWSIRWTSVPGAELTSRMIQLCFREIRPSMKRYFVRNRLSANRYSVIVLHP